VDRVILVDENDRQIGVAEKLAAHRDGGRLHRAFSIFLFNAAGEMLLQRRSRRKYHFGGLWTNACCGHPRPGEELVAAAQRRLGEELGIHVPLRPVFWLIYSASDEASGLSERELDHVLVGQAQGGLEPDPAEVEDLRWVDCDEVLLDATAHPERYTPWFCEILTRLPELRPGA
jgi:isopentenyl-diphosphate delta-isomerase